MKAPTGKLAFAYRTIATLEAERDQLRAEVERCAEIAAQNASDAGALYAEVETLREIREIASKCAANGGYLNSQDLIELRELLRATK